VILLLLSCARPPDPCDSMCAAAGELLSACVEDWELDWPAVGYDSEADFRDRCQTWAWEARLLERDARRRGEAERGAVDALCEQREDSLRAAIEEPTCEAWTDIDWSLLFP
jgi:hypothetical protein